MIDLKKKPRKVRSVDSERPCAKLKPGDSAEAYDCVVADVRVTRSKVEWSFRSNCSPSPLRGLPVTIQMTRQEVLLFATELLKKLAKSEEDFEEYITWSSGRFTVLIRQNHKIVNLWDMQINDENCGPYASRDKALRALWNQDTGNKEWDQSEEIPDVPQLSAWKTISDY